MTKMTVRELVWFRISKLWYNPAKIMKQFELDEQGRLIKKNKS